MKRNVLVSALVPLSSLLAGHRDMQPTAASTRPGATKRASRWVKVGTMGIMATSYRYHRVQLATGVGFRRLLIVPSPSSPLSFFPQQ